MKSKSKKQKLMYSIIAGIFVGFVNGFFGGGGGMIVVPLLSFILHLEDRKSHATAILCILPLSIASSIIYITKGSLNLSNLLLTSIGVIIGGIIGSFALKKMNNKILRVIFSFIMIVAGLKLMF